MLGVCQESFLNVAKNQKVLVRLVAGVGFEPIDYNRLLFNVYTISLLDRNGLVAKNPYK